MTPNQRRATRILIVDDHPIVRLGIRQLIDAESDLEVCAEAESQQAALATAKDVEPDLAIVDLALAEGTGLGLVQQLHESVPSLPVLVLSMHDEALYAERVLRAGARGYIMKREAITGLIGAIRQILSGRVYVSDAMGQTLLQRLGRDEATPGDPLARLTDREIQVLDLIGQGLGTAEIARTLGVSIKTIETYRSNVRTKLNLKDAADLIRFAATRNDRL